MERQANVNSYCPLESPGMLKVCWKSAMKRCVRVAFVISQANATIYLSYPPIYIFPPFFIQQRLVKPLLRNLVNVWPEDLPGKKKLDINFAAHLPTASHAQKLRFNIGSSWNHPSVFFWVGVTIFTALLCPAPDASSTTRTPATRSDRGNSDHLVTMSTGHYFPHSHYVICQYVS